MQEKESAVFETLLKSSTFPYVSEHRIQGAVVVPGTFFVEMAVATAMAEYGLRTPCLENVAFHEALFLPEQGERTVRFLLAPKQGGKAGFRIASVPSGSTFDSAAFTVHVTGDICLEPDIDAGSVPDSLNEIRSRCTGLLEGAEHADRLKSKGFEFGPAFREIVKIWCGDNESLGEVRLPENLLPDMASYYIHPALLDGCLQVCAGALRPELNENAYLPVAIGRFRLFRRATECVSSHARIQTAANTDSSVLDVDINVFDDAGELVATLTGLRIQQFDRVAPCAVRDRIRDFFYEIQWQLLEPTAGARDIDTHEHDSSSWILFSADKDANLIQSAGLENGGMPTVLVTPGDVYAHKGAHHVALKPDAVEQLRYLLGESTVTGASQCNLLYLSDFARGANGVEDSISVFDRCASLLALIQAVIASGKPGRFRLWIVTKGAHGIAKADCVDAGETALWGLARVFAREYPALWGGIVDLSGHESFETIRHLLAGFAGNLREDQIAYRDGHCYVARLVRSDVVLPEQQLFSARPDGTYLITGGFGGLGLEIAHWLVRQGARHLALLGRSTPTQGTASEIRGSVRPDHGEKIATLRQLGAIVYDLTVDVCDEQGMKSAMAELSERAPPVKGIIHAAGVSRDAMLENMTRVQLADVMRAKVTGASVLHTLSLSMELDFFVLFSSLSAVVGTPGQGNYAAANSFMGGLAQARARAGLTGLSIDWGPWDSVGMTKTMAAEEFIKQGVHPLLPEQGCEALGVLLASPQGSVQKVVSHISGDAFARYATSRSIRNLMKDVMTPAVLPDSAEKSVQADAGTAFLNRLLPPGPANRRVENIITYLQGQVAKILGMAASQRVDPGEPLLNYGFESLMALRLRSHLENELQRTFSATLVFDYPTVGELAAFLEHELFVEDNVYHGDIDNEDDAILALLEEVEQLPEHNIQSHLAP